MILGFSGYLIFGEDVFAYSIKSMLLRRPSGLIIGLAYERITKIIPLFVVLCVIFCL